MKKYFKITLLIFMLISLFPNVLQTLANNIVNNEINIKYEIKEINEEKDNISFILNENTSFNKSDSSNDFNIKEIKDLDTNTILTSLDYEVNKKDEYHFLINYVNNLDELEYNKEIKIDNIRNKQTNKLEESKKITNNNQKEVIQNPNIVGFNFETESFESDEARNKYIDETYNHYNENGLEVLAKTKINEEIIIVPSQYNGKTITLVDAPYDGETNEIFPQNVKKIIFEKSDKKIIDNNIVKLFYNLTNLIEVKNIYMVDSVKNLEKLFAKCNNLEIVNFNNFDTNNVSSLRGMFLDCTNLISIDY